MFFSDTSRPYPRRSQKNPLLKEVQTHALGVPVFHPVIELVVVAVIEALLLQYPLQVPVCLGDELELPMPALDRRDDRRSIVVDRLCFRPGSPLCEGFPGRCLSLWTAEVLIHMAGTHSVFPEASS